MTHSPRISDQPLRQMAEVRLVSAHISSRSLQIDLIFGSTDFLEFGLSGAVSEILSYLPPVVPDRLLIVDELGTFNFLEDMDQDCFWVSPLGTLLRLTRRIHLSRRLCTLASRDHLDQETRPTRPLKASHALST